MEKVRGGIGQDPATKVTTYYRTYIPAATSGRMVCTASDGRLAGCTGTGVGGTDEVGPGGT